LSEFAAESHTGDAEQLGSLLLVTANVLKHSFDQEAVDGVSNLSVDVGAAGMKKLSGECHDVDLDCWAGVEEVCISWGSVSGRSDAAGLWQAVDRDYITGGVDGSIFHGAFELADISWPRVLLQDSDRVDRDIPARRTGGVCDSLQELTGEFRDIFRTAAKRWDLNRKDVEAIEEVASKRPGFDHGRQIAICGCDDAHIGLDCGVATDSFKLLLLQEAKSFGLCGGTHISDFIQQNCAAVHLFEFSNPSLLGTRERSAFMTEEFAFEQ
jgi:hypothetical protein